MRLKAPFYALGEHIAIDLPGGRAVFTTRRGGVSRGPFASLNLGRLTADDPAAVERNRALLRAQLGVRTAMIRQVHGARVRHLVSPSEGGAPAEAYGQPAEAYGQPAEAYGQPAEAYGQPAEAHGQPAETDGQFAEADGQVTTLAGVAPMVLVADCLPIALIGGGAVAILHVGWRGLAAGIIANGVGSVRRLGTGGPLTAAIGPGAGPCCYEVGEEVHLSFAGYGPRARCGDRLDMKAIAREQLERAGVDTVHDVGLCTICSDPALFFSHRRDRGLTGRQAGVAWLSRSGA